MHKGEIERLIGKIREGGLTLVPLSLYFSDGRCKCELALARGKRSYDKRADLAKRDAKREIQRAYGRRPRGGRGSCGDPGAAGGTTRTSRGSSRSWACPASSTRTCTSCPTA